MDAPPEVVAEAEPDMMPAVPMGAHEVRLAEVKARRLQLEATKATRLRDWVVSGIATSAAERVTLDAEIAVLAVEQHRLGQIANQEACERNRQIRNQLLGKLLEVLAERGHSDLIREAQRRMEPA